MKFKVGEHVKVVCYPDKDVTGNITSITQEHTIDWKFFTSYNVTYDEPVERNASVGPPFITGGQHRASDLARVT